MSINPFVAVIAVLSAIYTVVFFSTVFAHPEIFACSDKVICDIKN